MRYELDVLDHLDERQFQLTVRRLADSLHFGSDRSLFVGSGVEYMQSRLYQDGDPVKAIDWKVTARTGKYHLKEYEAPKHLPVRLLVDTSASMCVGSGARTKYAWAVQLAGALALAALARISPVGLHTCGERAMSVPPSMSRATVYQWLHQLRRYTLAERTTLAEVVAKLLPSIESRSVLVVLSDLHDPAALARLKEAAQEHEVVALHLHDPAERGSLGIGFYRGKEAETGCAYVAHGRQRLLDAEPVAAALRGGGVDYLLLPTDRDFLPDLRHFLKTRGQSSGATRS